MISLSVWNSSWGISVKNGRCVTMVILINLRLPYCFCVSCEKFIIGKYISALGKVVFAVQKRLFNCLVVVSLRSWSVLLSPVEKITILRECSRFCRRGCNDHRVV